MSSKWLLSIFSISLWTIVVLANEAGNNARKTIADCAAAIFDAENGAIQNQVENGLRLRGVDPRTVPAVKDVHQICMQVPEASQVCQPVGSSWWTNRVNKKLLYQMTEGAKFAGQFHVDVAGRRNPLFGFKEVVFVSASEMPGFLSMKLASERLYVRIPGRLEYSPYSALHLRHLWDQGAMFPPFTSMRRRWRYLNPVGPFRVGVRNALKSSAQLAQKKIADLKGMVEESPAAVISDLETLVDVGRMEQRLVEKLRRATPEQLKRVLAHMEKGLSDDDTSEALIDAAIVSALVDSPPRNYNVIMIGGVNIGNFHDIGIRLRLGLLRYVKIEEAAPKTTAIVIGAVNIYTIDDVKVTIDFNRSRETAALENSLLTI